MLNNVGERAGAADNIDLLKRGRSFERRCPHRRRDHLPDYVLVCAHCGDLITNISHHHDSLQKGATADRLTTRSGTTVLSLSRTRPLEPEQSKKSPINQPYHWLFNSVIQPTSWPFERRPERADLMVLLSHLARHGYN